MAILGGDAAIVKPIVRHQAVFVASQQRRVGSVDLLFGAHVIPEPDFVNHAGVEGAGGQRDQPGAGRQRLFAAANLARDDAIQPQGESTGSMIKAGRHMRPSTPIRLHRIDRGGAIASLIAGRIRVVNRDPIIAFQTQTIVDQLATLAGSRGIIPHTTL